jgi:DNA-binding transcriptional ArsR family regulator
MTVVEDVLGALADPTRRTLLDHIARHGTATATMLAHELPISRQGVTQHLSLLSSAGLVEGRRAGRERRFRVRPEALLDTSAWMSDLARQWDVRLARIKGLAEAAPPPE